MDKHSKHEPMRVLSLDEKWFKGVNPAAKHHLLNSMKSLSRGRAPTPSFKLYGKTDSSLVDDFFNSLRRSGKRYPKWLLEYEMSRLTKWGPQGGYKPWSDLKELFELYYSRPTEFDPKLNLEYENILRKNANKYAKLNCRIASYSDVLSSLIKDDKIQERASGWRDFNLRKTDKQAQVNALQDAADGDWQDGWFYTFSRFNKQKPRIFFPGPFSFMLVEAQFFYPFLQAIQKDLLLHQDSSPFIFWADKIGFDKQFDIIQQILEYMAAGSDECYVYVQRDFEKMDTTVGLDQTLASFYPKLLAAHGLRRPSLYANKLLDALTFGATAPVATPSGMYTGYRGKASGANTTNGDETCCNEDYDAILQYELKKLCKQDNITYFKVYSAGNGDDGMTIYTTRNTPGNLAKFQANIRKAAEKAADYFGFRIQADKWHISTDYGLYCQRLYYVDSEDNIHHMYPATLVLNSIVNPEKQYSKSEWDKDYRDLDIIEKLDNARGLPYYHELVDFVDNGMKYRLLGRSEKETSRILSKWERYRALQDDAFNHESMDYKDITKSPTVQYLLNKRSSSHS